MKPCSAQYPGGVTDLAPHPSAYYLRVDERTFMPTLNAQGAWKDIEQHAGPVTALVAWAIEAHEPRDDMQIGRITFEILGMMAAAETVVEVETVRPGRTIELVEATAVIGGRPVVRARAWRLSKQDTSVHVGNELASIAGREHGTHYDPTIEWPGGFLRSLTVRELPDGRSGKRAVWVKPLPEVVADEPQTPVASFLLGCDCANGMATRIHPQKLMFPNVELSLHLLREPCPEWVGLDVTVSFGDTGLGLTSTTVHDEHGPVGRLEQCLTVREFPS